MTAGSIFSAALPVRAPRARLSIEYVGRNDFPKTLPDFLLRQWFTLNARDRRAIRKAFRSRQWIGAALQLGFLGMTGTTLRSLEYVPAAVKRRGTARCLRCAARRWHRP